MSEIGLDCKRANALFAGETEVCDENVTPEAARAAWIGEFARADGAALRALWAEFGDSTPHQILRGPEIGLVMARGRAGGSGEAFNVGEITATRCVVKLDSGEVGVSYALGRDKEKARISAVCDALLQTAASEDVQTKIVEPLRAARLRAAQAQTEAAAATKVEFFTMTRGEDD